MEEKMNLFVKRVFDIVCSLVGIIILSPLFLIVSIAIKLDSKGSVLFKQERRTKNGRVFKIYKFRSMCLDAEKKGTGLFNFENDSRITKVGKFLRNSSIDELPQLINVIKGDLSLVGPRPCVKYELGDFETLNRKYKKRFQVRAGITGLAQVKGRNENSWDEKVTYDNQYVDLFAKQGIWLDIKILFETVVEIFKMRNIHEVKSNKNMDDVMAAQMAEQDIIDIAHLPDDE